LSDTSVRQRLAAILAADVAGYTRLMAGDERGTLTALDAARRVFQIQIESNQGRVIDMAGDSVLAVFETAIGAVTAALAVQKALCAASEALPQAQRMYFRIGVHLGDVIEKADGTVYGDGVNIAARLQGLAEPGGVTVSESVRIAVRTRLAACFEDRGEQRVKNIAEPVRAYRVRPDSTSTPKADAVPASGPTKSDKPAIAVLPFVNMSGEADQEYFSDGITEDLITDLSKLSGLWVIARNSTFTYKGRPVDVRQVGREFDVSHVLEGSVRRAGGHVRITAQLVEAATSHHVWAERYDRDLEDVFAIQDEITREIVTALDVRLLHGEQAAGWRKSLRRADALDSYYRGLDLFNRVTREANAEAVECFDRVIELEPGSPLGYLGTAWTHLSAFRYGWSDSPAVSLKCAGQLASKALELDEQCADAHALLGYYHLLNSAHDRAIAEGERAIALSPNHADNSANLACSYAVADQQAQAIPLLQRAIRLSPIYPTWYLNILGFAHHRCGQDEEAETALKLALQREPGNARCRMLLAWVYHARGQMDEARRETRELLRHDPAFRLKSVEPQLAIIKDRTLVAKYFEVLRELGLQ
jgi:adenylate cyclase